METHRKTEHIWRYQITKVRTLFLKFILSQGQNTKVGKKVFITFPSSNSNQQLQVISCPQVQSNFLISQKERRESIMPSTQQFWDGEGKEGHKSLIMSPGNKRKAHARIKKVMVAFWTPDSLFILLREIVRKG